MNEKGREERVSAMILFLSLIFLPRFPQYFTLGRVFKLNFQTEVLSIEYPAA